MKKTETSTQDLSKSKKWTFHSWKRSFNICLYLITRGWRFRHWRKDSKEWCCREPSRRPSTEHRAKLFHLWEQQNCRIRGHLCVTLPSELVLETWEPQHQKQQTIKRDHWRSSWGNPRIERTKGKLNLRLLSILNYTLLYFRQWIWERIISMIECWHGLQNPWRIT